MGVAEALEVLDNVEEAVAEAPGLDVLVGVELVVTSRITLLESVLPPGAPSPCPPPGPS